MPRSPVPRALRRPERKEHHAPGPRPDGRFRQRRRGGEERPDAASLRQAFQEIIWPRRKLVLLGLCLILVNRLAAWCYRPPPSTWWTTSSQRRTSASCTRSWRPWGSPWSLQAVSSYLLTLLLSVEAQRLIADLRAQVQHHVLRPPDADLRQRQERRAGVAHHGRRGGRPEPGGDRARATGGRRGDRGGGSRLPAPHRRAHDRHGHRAPGGLRRRLHPSLPDPAARLPGARADPGRGHGSAHRGAGRHPGHQGLPRHGEGGARSSTPGCCGSSTTCGPPSPPPAAVTSLGTLFVGLASVLIMGYGGHLVVRTGSRWASSSPSPSSWVS